MANRVIMHERVAEITKRRLLQLQKLTGGPEKGMSRGQLLDDIMWMAEAIILNPEQFTGSPLIYHYASRINEAIRKEEGEALKNG